MRTADWELKVRAAGVDDLAAVLALVAVTMELPRWPKDVWEGLVGLQEDRARGRRMLLGVEATGRIRGLVAGAALDDVAELEYAWVDREYRRRGLGRALVESWLAWARGQGAAEVFLEVRASNEAAIALYLRVGFAEQGIRRGYYRVPLEDARVMRLKLQARA